MERSNNIFKPILERLCKNPTSTNDFILVLRAPMPNYMIYGSSLISTLQLAWVFSSLVFWLSTTTISRQLMDSHVEMNSIRALQNVKHAITTTSLPPSSLPPGCCLWSYYSTSNENKPVQWLNATVAEALLQMVKCTRSQKGPLITVSYELERLKPQS